MQAAGSADWLSYSLQDFIMFTPQVFLRLFVRINQDLWPWPLVIAVLTLAVPFLLVHKRSIFRRLGMALCAVAWLGSGYGFLVGYYGKINWPAAWLGWCFVLQGMLLLALAIAASSSTIRRPGSGFTVLWLFAVLGLPWITVIAAGQWQALALFGLAPDTTGAASVLLAMSLSGYQRWLCLIIPLIWVVFSAATLWGLQTPELLLFPLSTLMLAIAAVRLSPSRAQSPG